jgi:23S rRNA (guanosine2251-2'-O)-methyltransferase
LKEWITGRNPVFEVLRAHRRQVFRLWMAEGVQEKGRLADIQRLAVERKIPVERLPRHRVEALGENPQGMALETSGYPYVDFQDIRDQAASRNEDLFVLLLDLVQNPQNLGTLIRTAEAVGVHGTLLPYRHAAVITPAVVSASAGASEHMLVAQMNLAQAIEKLKQAGVWVVGLEGSRDQDSPEPRMLKGPVALVVGNEGEGMRPLVRQSCDVLLSLPMQGKVDSYNAAVAGSIALYLAYQARREVRQHGGS